MWTYMDGSYFLYNILPLHLFSRTIDRSVFKPIVQIAVINRSESSDCHLLAVTHAGIMQILFIDRCTNIIALWVLRIVFFCCAGVRLYFSTTPFAPPNAKHTQARPSILALVHVRLPPGFSASSTLQKPAKIHKALYDKGVVLMAASETEDNDVLWCINHDSFPFKKPLMEAQVSLVDTYCLSTRQFVFILTHMS